MSDKKDPLDNKKDSNNNSGGGKDSKSSTASKDRRSSAVTNGGSVERIGSASASGPVSSSTVVVGDKGKGGNIGESDKGNPSELNDVAVLDIGSGFIKAGWAGEDAPRCVVPSLLIDVHGQALPAAALDTHTEQHDFLIGQAALQYLKDSASKSPTVLSNISIIKPIERGRIKDFSSLARLLDYIFQKELRISPREFSVLCLLPPLLSPEEREGIGRLFFDSFSVPSLAFLNAAVGALFSTGRTTGVVLEVGEGIVHSVPIFEGFSLRHAMLSAPLSGDDATKFLMKMLSERGYNFQDSQFDTVRDIKEKLCKVKKNPIAKNNDGKIIFGDDEKLGGGGSIGIDGK